MVGSVKFQDQVCLLPEETIPDSAVNNASDTFFGSSGSAKDWCRNAPLLGTPEVYFF
jgi:hypothetical protein